ncbi:MAG: hypothetical protein IK079_04190, partial [Desulfovibrio sp.]|nr:hypothetical protein [Desulfovibrio sp.]
MHPKFNLLICPDAQILRTQAQALLAQHPADTGTWQKKVYWGDEEPNTAFWQQFTQSQLFGTCTAMFLHHVEGWSQKTLKKLDIVLQETVPTSWPLLFIEVPWAPPKKGAQPAPKLPDTITAWKSYAQAEKRGWIWRHAGITEQNVGQYLKNRCQALKLNLPNETLQRLSYSVPLDARAIENELNKYALYLSSSASQTTKNILSTVREKEINIFDCITDIERAMTGKVLQNLLSQKDVEKQYFFLAAMLDRELRILWQLKSGCSVSLHPSIMRMKQNLARRISFDQIAKGMSLLVESEWQIKRNDLSTIQSLENLIIKMTALFAQNT